MANGEAYKKEMKELSRLADKGMLTYDHYYYKQLSQKTNVPEVAAFLAEIRPKMKG